MRVVRYRIPQILRIPFHNLRLHVPVAVDAQHVAVPGDHLLGAVPHEIEHVVDGLLEEQRAFAIVAQLEAVPEELLGAVAIPVAAHEIGVAT